jgi:hypothetical protein
MITITYTRYILDIESSIKKDDIYYSKYFKKYAGCDNLDSGSSMNELMLAKEKASSWLKSHYGEVYIEIYTKNEPIIIRINNHNEFFEDMFSNSINVSKDDSFLTVYSI